MKNFKQVLKDNFVTISVIFMMFLCVIISIAYSVFSKKNIIIDNREKSSLTFQPLDVKTNVNENFSIDVIINKDESAQIQGYNLKLQFDKNKINITNIDFSFGSPCSGLSDTTSDLDSINTNGELYICSESQSANGETLNIGKQNLITFKFVSISGGESKLKFDSSSSDSIYKIASNGALEKEDLQISDEVNIHD